MSCFAVFTSVWLCDVLHAELLWLHSSHVAIALSMLPGCLKRQHRPMCTALNAAQREAIRLLLLRCLLMTLCCSHCGEIEHNIRYSAYITGLFSADCGTIDQYMLTLPVLTYKRLLNRLLHTRRA